jgi:hypothetical protein
MANWIPVLQWGLPILVSVVIAFFGWRQWMATRKDQLKLHFYDKRKEISEAFFEFLEQATLLKGFVTEEDLNNFTYRTKDLRDLFNDEITNLRDQLIKEGTQQIGDGEVMKCDYCPNREELAFTYGKRRKWFYQVLKALPAKLDTYL